MMPAKHKAWRSSLFCAPLWAASTGLWELLPTGSRRREKLPVRFLGLLDPWWHRRGDKERLLRGHGNGVQDKGSASSLTLSRQRRRCCCCCPVAPSSSLSPPWDWSGSGTWTLWKFYGQEEPEPEEEPELELEADEKVSDSVFLRFENRVSRMALIRFWHLSWHGNLGSHGLSCTWKALLVQPLAGQPRTRLPCAPHMLSLLVPLRLLCRLCETTQTATRVAVHWLNNGGVEQLFYTLDKGCSITQETSVGNVWHIREDVAERRLICALKVRQGSSLPPSWLCRSLSNGMALRSRMAWPSSSPFGASVQLPLPRLAHSIHPCPPSLCIVALPGSREGRKAPAVLL